MYYRFIYILIISLLITACEEDTVFDESKYLCVNTVVNNHPDSQKFQDYIDKKVKEGLPGIAMMIETPSGVWAGASGFSDIASNVSMEPCSLSRVGSITKMFTATLIMNLYDNGKLQLTDKISNYLDAEIIDNVNNANNVTIQHLLNHTSGITNFETDAFFLDVFNKPNKHWTAEESITYAYNKSADFETGTALGYSNTNYLLLGLIAENITEKTGTELYKEIIFEPLGLTDTRFNQESNIPDNIARGYRDYFGDLVIEDVTEITYAYNSMEGGIASTVLDLNLFMKGILTPNLILSENAIQVMRTWVLGDVIFEGDFPTELNSNLIEVNQAFGWAGFTTPYGNAIGHNGDLLGYSANMFYFPDSEIYISYIINGAGGEINNIIDNEIDSKEIVELLFE